MNINKKITEVLLLMLTIMFLSACGIESSQQRKATSETEVLEENYESFDETETKYGDFRNSFWGDTMAKVRIQEKDLKFLANSTRERITSRGRIYGYDCDITFVFDNRKLVRGSYIIGNDYGTGEKYMSVYERIKEKLNEKYAVPIEDKILCHKNKEQIDAAGPSRALSLGYVSYETKWETENTEILLQMSTKEKRGTEILIFHKYKNFD